MNDTTEPVRRTMVSTINAEPGSREALEQKYGRVWDTNQIGQDFEVTGFMAPFMTVKRKSDGAAGSLMFQHNPRFYFSFTENK